MTVDTLQNKLIEKGWAALPAEYRIPDQAPTLEQARAYFQRLAETHYENFHGVSWFLPRRLRPHFHSIYADCRISDDPGDEVGDRAQSLALLDLWGQELGACYRGEARHPVFVALAFSLGGLEILHAIEQQDYDVLCARPSISKTKKVALLLRALSGKSLGRRAA